MSMSLSEQGSFSKKLSRRELLKWSAATIASGFVAAAASTTAVARVLNTDCSPRAIPEDISSQAEDHDRLRQQVYASVRDDNLDEARKILAADPSLVDNILAYIQRDHLTEVNAAGTKACQAKKEQSLMPPIIFAIAGSLSSIWSAGHLVPDTPPRLNQ